MIERFTVENYRSYQKEEILSFVASNKEKSSLPPQWYKEIDGKKILRLLLCVGLNGTGKSKMFSALSYLRMIATEKPDKPTDTPVFRPFLLDDESRNKPTKLSLLYYMDNVSYYYKVIVSTDRIEEEELRMPGAADGRIYSRTYDKEKDTVVIKFGPACDLNKQDQRMLEANVISNSTVLSVFGAGNYESKILRSNYDYFYHRLSMVRRSDQSLADRLQTGDAERDKRVKTLLLKLLKDVGTNIVNYEVDDTSIRIADLIKSGAPDIVVKAMQEQYPSGIISHKNLRFIHKTAEAGEKDLDSGWESFGTINIIRLLVVMYDIVMGRKCATIDEIDAGVHAKALAFIMKMYLSIAEECQIAVATHDLSLLGQPELRRDAVRMFEKDENGCTYIKKHEYVHNTINFQRLYCKKVDPKLDKLLDDGELFKEYRDLVYHYLCELYDEHSVKK